jgi:hypothetical protein
MIGLVEVLTGMNILEKSGKVWRWMRGKQLTSVDTIATRFVHLLENHGVHRNQIPRFIGHGLTLKDVQDDAALLAKLDEPLLQDVCERFAVRREWLDGAEKQIYPTHDFYKAPDAFSTFLESLITANLDAHLQGVLIAPEERDVRANALIILQETIGNIGDKPIYRFHLCNNWSFTYWKARACLTACIAIAWKKHVFIHGEYQPKKLIERLEEGEALLGWQGNGIWGHGHRKWYAEDLALLPEIFLNGVDSERDNFGIRAGLEMWLDLEQNGLMDTGLDKNVRELFQKELAKY